MSIFVEKFANMDSNTLIRYILGYTFVIFLFGFIVVVVGRMLYVVLQDVFKCIIYLYRGMSKIPDKIKKAWPKIREAIIALLCLCGLMLFGFCMLYDCYDRNYGNHNYHNQEEIEDIMDNPQWDVPSRYRD